MSAKKATAFSTIKNMAEAALKANRLESKTAQKELLIAVFVDTTAPHELVVALKNTLVPTTTKILVDVFGDVPQSINRQHYDLALVACGSRIDLCQQMIKAAKTCSTETAVICESVLDLDEELKKDISSFAQSGQAYFSLIYASDARALQAQLGSWMVAAAGDLAPLCAEAFPFCHDTYIQNVIRDCAVQNAVVAALPFVKRAHLPLMCVNQVQMVSKIAQVHPQVPQERLYASYLALFVAAFGYRGVARGLLHAFPYAKFFIQLGVSLAGTYTSATLVTQILEKDVVDRAIEFAATKGQQSTAKIQLKPSLMAKSSIPQD